MHRLSRYWALFLALTILAMAITRQPGSQSQATVHHTTSLSDTQRLVRINQLDHTQYHSRQEYVTWAYSTCSTAAMTEVFDFYGRHYRITDVLQVEAALHEITPALGLIEDSGIGRTAARLGFTTSWGYSLSLDQVIVSANHGRPVIVGWPPTRYPHGHLVVVTGGDRHVVLLADSSQFNRTRFPRAVFLQLWGGFSAIVTPA